MGHDLHPDPELGQARRLRGSDAKGGVIEEMAPAWVQLPTMSHNEIRPVEKLMRDAKIMQLYEGASQNQRLVIAREVLMPRRVEEPATAAA